MIEVRNLTVSYHRAPPVLKNISLRVGRGEVVNVLGPNGCGKTTLLRALLGLLPAPPGSIVLDGCPLEKIRRRNLARSLAYVPQQHTGVFGFQVLDVVLMGRTVRSPWLRFSARDREWAMDALEKVRLAHLADRSYLELSGGQRQMVLIARALAQDCAALVMDEPVTGLDYGNQFHLLDLIGELACSGPAILLTTHHPEQAVYLGGRAVLLKNGILVADGPVASVITEEQVRKLYELPPKAEVWMRLTGTSTA
ncbi:ABC transporter ATP-binding protein [Desulfovibrio falkowii]|uniref:ABC transporter ATP-binding protein n=1 Tax=Desulfovibrio sp. WGS1351 TaxID=3366814 RepID=UPI00372D452D